ncbi:MAG: NfeD family protein [Clostridia bacterium]|nr:NfeD family protein [Clostridia bacterium]
MTGAIIVWLVIAVAFGVLESVTVALVSVWMAAGAILAAIAAAFEVSLLGQILVFLLSSAILLLLTAPLSRKFRNQEKTSTNADRLLGQEGVVLTAIDSVENKGSVKVMGQIWSASAQTPIQEGERVVVKAIEGVHLMVEKKL